MALTATVLFAALVAGVSSFLFGYNMTVVSNPRIIVSQWIRNVQCVRQNGQANNETSNNIWCKYYTPAQTETLMFEENSQLNTLFTLVSSMLPLGALVIVPFASYIVEKFGRKGTLMLNNVTAIIGAVCMFVSYWARSFELLIVGRVIMGFNTGINSAIPPMYMTEIAPPELRGAIGTMAALLNVFGGFTAQVLGLPQIFGNSWGWPYLFGIALVFSLIQLCTLPFCPESPRHLYLNRGQAGKAEIALKYFQRSGSVTKEMTHMEEEYIAAKETPKVSMLDLFRNPFLRGIIIICIMAMLSQQLAGINVVMFYSTAVFISAGLEGIYASYATIGMGAMFFFISLLSMAIVEKAGRKLLLLIGLLGMMVMTVLLVICMSLSKSGHVWAQYMSVVSVAVFLMFYGIGPGPIPWFIANELFTQGPRAPAMSVVAIVNWACTLLITLGFPLIEPYLMQYTFLIFTVFCAGFAVYTYFKVPETKGKRIDEIQDELKRRFVKLK